MEIISIIISIIALLVAVSANHKANRLLKAINRQTTDQSSASEQNAQALQAEQEQKIQNAHVGRQDAVFKWQTQKTHDSAEGPVYGGVAFEHKESEFVRWLKTNTLMKIGAAFILGAFLWFVSLSYSYGWIGPYTIIFSALLISAFTAFYGFYDALKFNIKRGLVLLGLGNAMALVTIFAAQNLYQMFPVQIAFLIIFALTAFVVFASVRFNSKALSFASFLFASIIPFILNAKTGDFYGFMGYLLVLLVAYSFIAFYRNWHELQIANLAVFVIYSLISFAEFDINFEKTLFAFVFPALFFAGAVYALVRFDDKKTKRIYLSLSLIYTLSISAWTYAGLLNYKDMIAPIFIAWSFALLLLSFGSATIYRNTAPFLVFGASALFLLSLAIIKLVPVSALPSVFTVEAVLATLFATFLVKDGRATVKTSYIFAIPFLFNLVELLSFYEAFSSDIFSKHALSVYFYTIIVVALAELIRFIFKQNYSAIKESLYLLYGTAGFFVFALVWIIPHKLFAQDPATFISIFIYTVAGFLLYTNKHPNEKSRKYLKDAGIALFAFVIGRVLLVDVWNLDVIFRIIVFAFIGVALIATAYRFSHRDKLKESSSDKINSGI